MKIAFVIPHYPTQTHVFFWREIGELRERGIDVHVLSTRPPPAAETCHAWTPQALASTTYLSPVGAGALVRGLALAVTSLPPRGGDVWRRLRESEPHGPRGWARAVAMAGMGAVTAAWIRRLGVTHVHAHSCADAALIACLAAAWTGVPYSMTLHGPIEHYREAQAVKWGHAAFAITVTRRLRDQVLAQVPGVDPSRVHVAAMGVDVGHFRRPEPWTPPPAGAPWRIATCGRLHRAKGHQDLVAAVGILTERGRDVRLTVIGEGPDRAAIEERVAALRLADRVELTGAIDSERVRQVLAASHVFALGSHDEAIGVATMEAMAMDLPVVVTDVGGVRELVREGTDGLFVPAQDPAAMAAALARVMDDAARAKAMGESGGARVREHFHSGVSAEVIAAQLRGRAPAGTGR